MAIYYYENKMLDQYNYYCERIYKNIYEVLKNELSNVIERIIKRNSSVK
jgi:hypothetical protein